MSAVTASNFFLAEQYEIDLSDFNKSQQTVKRRNNNQRFNTVYFAKHTLISPSQR